MGELESAAIWPSERSRVVRRRCVDNAVRTEGAIQAVTSARSHVRSRLFGLLFVAFSVLILANCSADNGGEPESATPETVATPDEATSTGDESSAATDGAPAATVVAKPSLADEDLASVTDLVAGAQIEDAQGNLISIYGLAEWPETFEDLSDATQAAFPFFRDVAAVGDPVAELVVLDIGMCSAGIDAAGFGTAEFSYTTRSTTWCPPTRPSTGACLLAIRSCNQVSVSPPPPRAPVVCYRCCGLAKMRRRSLVMS